jgi:hypothetical protein
MNAEHQIAPRTTNKSNYRPLNHLTVTSNIVERLFSRAKIIMTQKKQL